MSSPPSITGMGDPQAKLINDQLSSIVVYQMVGRVVLSCFSGHCHPENVSSSLFGTNWYRHAVKISTCPHSNGMNFKQIVLLKNLLRRIVCQRRRSLNPFVCFLQWILFAEFVFYPAQVNGKDFTVCVSKPNPKGRP